VADTLQGPEGGLRKKSAKDSSKRGLTLHTIAASNDNATQVC
jgi:hypothetical protein